MFSLFVYLQLYEVKVTMTLLLGLPIDLIDFAKRL
jgi:hypothetical protein